MLDLKRPHDCPLLSLLFWVQPQLIIKLVIQGGVLGDDQLGFLGNLMVQNNVGNVVIMKKWSKQIVCCCDSDKTYKQFVCVYKKQKLQLLTGGTPSPSPSLGSSGSSLVKAPSDGLVVADACERALEINKKQVI